MSRGPSEVRYVKETTFADGPGEIPLHEQWELTATFEERPVSIIATMKDGSTYRLDQP